MPEYFLAVDIGASSGRHILCHKEDGKMILEEIYRFPNGAKERNGHLCWDYDTLFSAILTGMKKCADAGKIPVSMGIDTWGVDYVLLDDDGKIVGDTYAYRDGRTAGMDAKLEKTLPYKDYFSICGIAKQPFNTVYQLMTVPDTDMEKARDFLLVPDYFNYLLTGEKRCEYTEASTTGMLDATTRDWDRRILSAAGIPERLFRHTTMPGEKLAMLKDEIAKEAGFDCTVVNVASHDTGSAYIAVPARNSHAAYLSSGTWSLFGVENDVPITNSMAMDAGFTNEGGYGGKIRFLKNIMGLWMLQCIRHENNDAYSFAEMADMAQNARDIPYRVDVSDNRFLAPASMTEELQAAVREQGGENLPLPELLRMVNLSLAEGYAVAVNQMEKITGNSYDTIHIVGGGCQNATLNQMTANASGRRVVAGPTEGTALGNLMVQMIAFGAFASVNEARESLYRSFDMKTYYPD